MLEILPIKGNELDILLTEANCPDTNDNIAFSASENGKDIGHIILSLQKELYVIVCLKVNDPNDIAAIDGLIRASAVIAAKRGYRGVVYRDNEYKKALLALGFVQNSNNLYFSVGNLVKNCKNCKNI